MQLVVFMRRILRRHAVFIPPDGTSVYGISGIGAAKGASSARRRRVLSSSWLWYAGIGFYRSD